MAPRNFSNMEGENDDRYLRLEKELETLKRQVSKLSDQLERTNSRFSDSTSISSLDSYKNKFTKKALELAIKHGLQDNIIEGSGSNGTICVRDIEKICSIKKTTMVCSGINKSGFQCKLKGKHEVRGKMYCNRHLEQAKKESKIIQKMDLKKQLSDDDSISKRMERLEILAKQEEKELKKKKTDKKKLWKKKEIIKQEEYDLSDNSSENNDEIDYEEEFDEQSFGCKEQEDINFDNYYDDVESVNSNDEINVE